MWKFLFSADGRISRSDIWLKYLLPYLGLSIVAAILDRAAFGKAGPEVLGLMLSLFYLWPSIAVSVKRFHDRGMSGWWVLWFTLIAMAFVLFGLTAVDFKTLTQLDPQNLERGLFTEPGAVIGFLGTFITSLVSFVILYIMPGQRGPNQYGEDPLQAN